MIQAEQKEKMKAISLILQCYNKRLDLLNFEPKVNELKKYIDSVKHTEKSIIRREKALQAYLEGRQLSEDAILASTSPQANFSPYFGQERIFC